MKNTEVNLNLNVHEIGILLSALQLLDRSDEKLISHEYGSSLTLYDKLYGVWEQMDRSNLEIRYETIIEPSF